MRVIRVEYVIGIDEDTRLGEELSFADEVEATQMIASVLNNHQKGSNQHAPFHVIASRGEDLDDELFLSDHQTNRKDSLTTASE